VLLLFPTGRAASRRWQLLVWIGVSCALLMVVGSMFAPGQMTDALRPASGPGVDFGVQNPVGINLLGPALQLADLAGRIGAFLIILMAAMGLVVRLVRARGDERQQLKWVAYVGSAIAVAILALIFVRSPGVQDFAFGVVLAGFVIGLPVATAIAVLKYRLYDIDIVINKSLVYGTLAVFISTVYVAIVVGIGHLVGTGGKPNLGLSILATALVAVAFQPVRECIQRVANRLVYGKRATPYEVLAEFSDRIASTYSDEEVLPRLAQTIAESTGAAQAVIWAKQGIENTALAYWPSANGSSIPSPAATDGSSSDRIVPVQHRGEVLGALSIRKARGDAVINITTGGGHGMSLEGRTLAAGQYKLDGRDQLVGYAKIPAERAGKGYRNQDFVTVSGGTGFALNPNTKHGQEAWALLSYMGSKEQVSALEQIQPSIPARIDVPAPGDPVVTGMTKLLPIAAIAARTAPTDTWLMRIVRASSAGVVATARAASTCGLSRMRPRPRQGRARPQRSPMAACGAWGRPRRLG